VAAFAGHQLPMGLQRLQQMGHSHRQILPARSATDRPHTLKDTDRLSVENFFGLPDRGRTARGVTACPSRRLTLSLHHPVTATTSSNSCDFAFLDAVRNARAYFAVISVLADTANSIPIPHSVHQWRAPTSEARPPPRAHYL